MMQIDAAEDTVSAEALEDAEAADFAGSMG
jgi:hypothetical protein